MCLRSNFRLQDFYVSERVSDFGWRAFCEKSADVESEKILRSRTILPVAQNYRYYQVMYRFLV
jgi:hypothetical protein